MKKKLISALILLSIVIASCKKTLEEYNPAGLTPEAVFTTPAGFETLVNAAYSYQRYWYGKDEGYNLSEMGTDLWVNGSDNTTPEIVNYVNLQGSNARVTTSWTRLYAAVNLCNAGINRISTIGLTDAVRDQREAELKFLRAFYYWHIVETWGGVNFTLEETSGLLTTANRTPVDKFYEQIISDLKFAIAHLSETNTDYGRVTKPAAEAFLSRIYLTRGSNREANDLAVDVIKNHGFSLVPNYSDLWKMANLKNPEIVYDVNYANSSAINDATGGNNGHLMFIMKYDDQPGMIRSLDYGRPYNRFVPTLFLLRLFNEQDDSRYDGSFKTVWYSNSGSRPAGMNLGDTAIFCTKYPVSATVQASKSYRTYDLNKLYKADGSLSNKSQAIQLSKFMDPTRTGINETISSRDTYVIRLAELYLNAAEAQFKLGNLDSAAYYVNVIRSRAAKPGHTAAMQVLPSQITLDFILDERAREFAGEQIRWFDLKRTGKLLERVKAHNPDIANNIQSFHLVRPIPQSQIDAVTNRDEFKQNEGYQ